MDFMKNGLALLILSLGLMTFTSCDDDNDDDLLTDNEISYNLESRNGSGMDGTITFVELTNGDIQATIDVENAVNGTVHPAHIHANSAALSGPILVSLDPVDGANGNSVTIFNSTDDGMMLTYQDILVLDAYVNVHKSADELNIIFSQVDIGGNQLTGEEIEYTFEERDIEDVSGSVIYKERRNGNALALIDLENTLDGVMHPAHIHANNAAEGGGILYTFTPVNGSFGSSASEVRAFDDGSPLTYDDIAGLNAYVNVHRSADQLDQLVAQTDIGLNVLTGDSKEYTLSEKDVAGISGNVLFEERLDGSILATISLMNTPEDGMHPAHIHENSAAEGGPIAVTFTPVDGATGMSKTSIRETDSGKALNYQQLLTYDGYVNVHLSADMLSTIVAQGDIGRNED